MKRAPSVGTARRPADYILCSVLLLLALVPATSGAGGAGDGKLVVRSPAGEWHYRLGTPRRVVLPGTDGPFVLEVSNGCARVVGSDCPDKRCLRMGPIARPGETIVCLPQRIEAFVAGDGEREVDAVCE